MSVRCWVRRRSEDDGEAAPWATAPGRRAGPRCGALATLPARQFVLGVDVGGVIVDRAGENSDISFFGGRPMETPAVSGVFEALSILIRGVFDGRVYLVSKAGPRTAATTRARLEHTGFHDQTGIPRNNRVHFVRDRREKEPVCAKLGVSHFVDDRLDVLSLPVRVRPQPLPVGRRARCPPASGDRPL